MEAKVVNIVAVGRLDGVDFLQCCKLFPDRISKKKIKGRRRVFTGAVIRLGTLCTCLLFPNGAVTAVGIRNLDKLPSILTRLIVILPAKHTITCVKPLKVCNIVASMSVGHRIDLPKLYNDLKRCCTYEPEMFPGLKISLTDVAAIVFHTGKVILTGAKTTADIQRGETEINDIIGRR